jgi:subtilase family serine protease
VPGAPTNRIYPACSQDHSRRSVVLGTSPGWSDDYPTDYDAQFVDVTGLHGRFLLVLIADPDNVILESREDNNRASRTVQIP